MLGLEPVEISQSPHPPRRSERVAAQPAQKSKPQPPAKKVDFWLCIIRVSPVLEKMSSDNLRKVNSLTHIEFDILATGISRDIA